MPFLENVTRGRGIPRERLEEVGEHYFQLRRRQPDQRPEPGADRRDRGGPRVQRRGPPGLLGQPQLGPLPRRRAAADGGRRGDAGGLLRHQRLLVLLRVPAVPREPRGRRRRGRRGRPRLDRLRHYFNHPGFVEPMVDATLAALADLPDAVRHDAHLLFVTHSIPTAMDDAQRPRPEAAPTSGSTAASWRRSSSGSARRPATATPRTWSTARGPGPARAVARARRERPPRGARRGRRPRRRRGPDRLRLRPHGGHLRPRHRGAATAEKLGLAFARAATAGVDPRFVAMVRDLLVERAAVERGVEVERAAVGSQPPSHDVCPAGCCANLRGPRVPRSADRELTHQESSTGTTSCWPSPSTSPARPPRWSRERRGAGVEVAATKSSPTDVVTEVDQAAEELIRTRRCWRPVPTTGSSARRGPATRPTAGSPGSSTRSTAP